MVASLIIQKKKVDLEKFIEEHKNTYDVIILNTCPLPWLDYNLIHQVLKLDGVLVVKLFGNQESSPSKEKDKSVINNIKKNTQNIPSHLFTRLDGQFSGHYTYKKLETQAQGRKLETTKRKRQNIKTRRKQRKQRSKRK
jgi:spermidine synthase